MPDPPPARRILVIRLGALGDVLRTLPSVARLRRHYPEAQISWLVESRAAGALEGNADLDEILIFPREDLTSALRAGKLASLGARVVRIASALRAPQFDLVLDFHSILKSGVLSRLTGAPVRVAYAAPFAREFAQLSATHRVALSPAKMSRFERNLGLVRGLGIDCPEAVDAYDYVLSADSSKRMRDWLASSLGQGSRPAILHPGTSRSTPYKRYSAEGYAAIARALFDEHGVRSIVTAGSAGEERDDACRVVKASGGAALLAGETRTIADLAALFSECRIFIGSDSGPLHLASLTGLPVVQLLGPTDPVENRPFGARWRTVRVPVACSPCRRGCASASCMRAIPPKRIAAAARELLQETEVRAPERAPAVLDRAHSRPAVRYLDA